MQPLEERMNREDPVSKSICDGEGKEGREGKGSRGKDEGEKEGGRLIRSIS